MLYLQTQIMQLKPTGSSLSTNYQILMTEGLLHNGILPPAGWDHPEPQALTTVHAPEFNRKAVN
jgi:hypothetical protein